MELRLYEEGAQAWAARTGHAVRVVSTPNSATERPALFQQFLAGAAPDIAVYRIDVIWPGLLAKHFIVLRPYSKGAEKEHFAAIESRIASGLQEAPTVHDVALAVSAVNRVDTTAMDSYFSTGSIDSN